MIWILSWCWELVLIVKLPFHNLSLFKIKINVFLLSTLLTKILFQTFLFVMLQNLITTKQNSTKFCIIPSTLSSIDLKAESIWGMKIELDTNGSILHDNWKSLKSDSFKGIFNF